MEYGLLGAHSTVNVVAQRRCGRLQEVWSPPWVWWLIDDVVGVAHRRCGGLLEM